MRIRIIKHPYYTKWSVETKNWWNFRWQHFMSFNGADADKQARQTALALANPTIIEVAS
jgi:hypothetical protein